MFTTSRRNRNVFRPTLDQLSLRLAPSGVIFEPPTTSDSPETPICDPVLHTQLEEPLEKLPAGAEQTGEGTDTEATTLDPVLVDLVLAVA